MGVGTDLTIEKSFIHQRASSKLNLFQGGRPALVGVIFRAPIEKILSDRGTASFLYPVRVLRAGFRMAAE